MLEAPGSLDATALASLPALRNLIGSTASRAWIQPHTDGRRNNPMMRGLPGRCNADTGPHATPHGCGNERGGNLRPEPRVASGRKAGIEAAHGCERLGASRACAGGDTFPAWPSG